MCDRYRMTIAWRRAVFAVAFVAAHPFAQDLPPETAYQVNALQAKASLAHFEDYLSKCPKDEIRCLWFLEDRVGAGMVMTINLRDLTVYTVRDIYNHACQGSQTRELSYQQAETAKQVVSSLSKCPPKWSFTGALHISFWRDGKQQTMSFSKKAVPAAVQRLYDVGGGPASFIYTKAE